jgi:tetratricopeptide (TPR) repeat protein
MRPQARLAAFLSLCICAWPAAAEAPAPAPISASEHFAAGSRAFEQGDFAQALADFKAAIESGQQGPAVHYNAAVCYFKLGDYRSAENAFKDLAQRFPAMQDLAEYNLGLALTEQGRRIEARDAFERVRAGSDAQVAALAATMLERLTAASVAPPPLPWTRLVDLRAGHDDNVALIDAASLPAGRTTDSSFAELFAYFSGPVGDRPWRVDASAYVVTYPDASEFDQRVIYAGTAREWRAGDWFVDVGPGVSHATIDGNGFEQRVGVVMNARHTTGNVMFAAQLAHDDIDDLEAQYAYVDGTLDQLALVVDSVVGSGRFIAAYYLERNDRADAGVSADRGRYVLRYRRLFNAAWITDFMYEYRKSDYTDLSPAREEKRWQLGVDLGRNVAPKWQVVMQYRFADNESNDAAYTYDRQRVSIGVSTIF